MSCVGFLGGTVVEVKGDEMTRWVWMVPVWYILSLIDDRLWSHELCPFV